MNAISVPVKFLELVASMRQQPRRHQAAVGVSLLHEGQGAQLDFFNKKEAHRSDLHLRNAKALEKQVDAYLAQIQIAVDRLDQFGKASSKEE
jgi:hypothetical protein